MSDHTLSIKYFSSPLKTDACSIILIALFKFKKSCWILYFYLKYAILFPKIKFALLDTYSKHELTKSLSLFFIQYINFKSRIYSLYVMCTESSKGPNNHVCVVFGKFKSLRTPTFHAVVQLLNPAEFNLHVLDPKKEQQYVLNKFINICGCTR